MLKSVNTEKKVLSDKIEAELIDYIKFSSLHPGSKIPNENELCSKLGVSRSTIREATKKLVSRNILEIRRGVGTFVSNNTGLIKDPLGLEFVEDKTNLLLDLFQFRTIIEPPLVELATKNAGNEEIENLCRIEEQLESAYESDLPTVQLDIEFHSEIARCSHNIVVELIFPILTKSIPMANLYTQKSLMESSIQDHRFIIQAITEKNPILASENMLCHLKRNIEYIKNLI